MSRQRKNAHWLARCRFRGNPVKVVVFI